MADKDFLGRVVGAASQGAVGAVVAAALSAVTEPIVNAILVKRATFGEALKELDPDRIKRFLQTTLSTNFIKFPFFEATNVVMQGIDLSPVLRGAALGTVFCTTTLPITNYRFRKSMDLPVNLPDLYQAYLPTVLRDILYGIVRNKVGGWLVSHNPDSVKTATGRAKNMAVTVFMACVLSAPGNELRGYCLQPKDRMQSFGDFFQPQKFVRSTSVGAVIMAIALGIGTLATPQVEALWGAIRDYLKANPIGYLLIILFAIQKIMDARSQEDLGARLEKKK